MMNRKRQIVRRAARGFTLLEMMAVIFIIGLIATLSTLAIIDQIQKARVNAAKAQIATFDQALELFQMDNGRYPTQEEGLDALVHEPADAVDYPPRGYLKLPEIPRDPWNNDYIYVLRDTEDGQEYAVISYGQGGQQGGEKFAADLVSRGENADEWLGGF
ncbi:MAG: type II secretion system major pseudopilin GspG [Planctomycetes bacterium]|nr:type II secretion system major pseudopilin GspG [Planctomycetota bacterium]